MEPCYHCLDEDAGEPTCTGACDWPPAVPMVTTKYGEVIGRSAPGDDAVYNTDGKLLGWWTDGGKTFIAVPTMQAEPKGITQAQAANLILEQLVEEENINRPDGVNQPYHYARWGMQPIEFIAVNGLDYFQGNVIKYLLRYDAKNGLEDLYKARSYLEMLVRKQEGHERWWEKPVATERAAKAQLDFRTEYDVSQTDA